MEGPIPQKRQPPKAHSELHEALKHLRRRHAVAFLETLRENGPRLPEGTIVGWLREDRRGH